MYKLNKLKKVLGDRLQEHVVLRSYTTMKVGGVADYFFEAKTVADLIEAVLAARADKIPFFILGGGSNVLISDFGYAGLVIHNKSSNISIIHDKSQIIADSGLNLSVLILKAVNSSLGGLEPLYGIPGTVGGAVYGNSGAYGTSIFDFIKSAIVLSPKNKIVNQGANWFEAIYHETRLKKQKKRTGESDHVVLTVRLQLAHNKREQLLENINKYKQERDKKFASLGPSCGSIFRNPSSGKSYKNSEEARKNSAGYLLEQVGAKSFKKTGVRVYNKHANIIENKENAKAIDVRNLIETMREKVRAEKGIVLEEEIEYLGQWE